MNCKTIVSFEGKGKPVRVPAMKICRGSRYIAPLILISGTW
jgi:hypothetical protein